MKAPLLPEVAEQQPLPPQQPPSSEGSAAGAAACSERQPLRGSGAERSEPLNYAAATPEARSESPESAGDAQPAELQRRGSFEHRRQFQEARDESWRRAMTNPDTWRSPRNLLMLSLVILLFMIPPIFIIYVEIRSFYTMLMHTSEVCDVNLSLWLIVRNMLTYCSPKMHEDEDEDLAARQRFMSRLVSTFLTFWLVLGFFWTTQAKTCQVTNPELYHWCRFLSLFGIFVHLVFIFLPFFLQFSAVVYHGLVRYGWLQSPNAASREAINRMDTVPYNAETFVQGEGPSVAPLECCCCMETFGEQKVIVCTPCTHYFHRDCLKEWLKVAKTCPLCRRDLDTQGP